MAKMGTARKSTGGRAPRLPISTSSPPTLTLTSSVRAELASTASSPVPEAALLRALPVAPLAATSPCHHGNGNDACPVMCGSQSFPSVVRDMALSQCVSEGKGGVEGETAGAHWTTPSVQHWPTSEETATTVPYHEAISKLDTTLPSSKVNEIRPTWTSSAPPTESLSPSSLSLPEPVLLTNGEEEQ